MARITKTMAERRFQNWAYQYMLTLERREERQAKGGRVLHYDEPQSKPLAQASRDAMREVIADSLGPMEDYRQTRYAAKLWKHNAEVAIAEVARLKRIIANAALEALGEGE